ncbi:MAG: ATP synthase F1 subunit gamma [Acholeplasmataceae bacterium]
MNLKEIKGRIKAVKKTGNITKAMESIALSKLKGATKVFDDAVLYDQQFKTIFKQFASHSEEASIFTDLPRGNKKLFILVTSDRGLAGPYHNHIFKRLEQDIVSDDYVLPIGKKGFQFVNKRGYKNILKDMVLNRDNIKTFDYNRLATLVIQLFQEGAFDSVWLAYNKHESISSHDSSIEMILPIDLEDTKKQETHIIETQDEQLFMKLMVNYVQSMLLQGLANAKLSEHASRMIAMKNATDNAKEIASKLEIVYHRARQQSITSELIDVINGSNV